MINLDKRRQRRLCTYVTVLFVLFCVMIGSFVYMYYLFKNDQRSQASLLFSRLCNRKKVETQQQLNGGITILTALSQYTRFTGIPSANDWVNATEQFVKQVEWKISLLSQLQFYQNASRETTLIPQPVSTSTQRVNVSESLLIVNNYPPDNGIFIGVDYFTDLLRFNLVKEANRTRTLQISPVLNSTFNRRGVLLFLPTYIGTRFVGGISGLYRSDVLIPEKEADAILFRITVNDAVFLQDPSFYRLDFFSVFPFTLQNANFVFSCAGIYNAPWTPEVILILGLLLSVVIPGVVIYSLRQVHLNNQENERRFRYEKEIEQAKLAERAALQSADLKSRFLANVSHEIRTPLNGITGVTEFLLDTTLSKLQQEYVDTIKNCSGTLLSLVNDVLDYSKAESNKLLLECLPCNVIVICKNVTNMFAQQAKVNSNVIDLQTTSDELWCVTDGGRLQQILSNLVANATKFTKNGTVTIAVSVQNEHLVFTVRDTGIGMSRDQIDNLFTAFSQADASTTRRYGGTGLGLVICKKLTRLLHGDIHVTSELGKGSTFTVQIPFKQCEKPVDVERQQKEPRKDYTLYREFAKGKTILVVDDSKVNLQVAETMLKKLGYSTLIAHDGEECVNMITLLPDATVSVDGILMDLQMPNMDGYTASRTLRERGFTKPIVAMTANALSGEKEKCLNCGMDDYLTKPVSMATLAEKLQEILESYFRDGRR